MWINYPLRRNIEPSIPNSCLNLSFLFNFISMTLILIIGDGPDYLSGELFMLHYSQMTLQISCDNFLAFWQGWIVASKLLLNLGLTFTFKNIIVMNILPMVVIILYLLCIMSREINILAFMYHKILIKINYAKREVLENLSGFERD